MDAAQGEDDSMKVSTVSHLLNYSVRTIAPYDLLMYHELWNLGLKVRIVSKNIP